MSNFNPLPKEIEDQPSISSSLEKNIASLLHSSHGHNLHHDEKIKIKGRLGSQHSWLQVSLGSETKAHLFEFATKKKSETNKSNILYVLVDFADAILKEFFKEKKEAWLTLDFSKHNFENIDIYARHEFRNLAVENLTERFLKKHNIS